MDAKKFIENIKEVVHKNYDDLKKNVHANITGVPFIVKTLDERDIRGGLDVWDKIQVIALGYEGWFKYVIESETNSYKYVGSKTISFNSKSLSDNDLEDYFNSKECTIGEVNQFIEKYNKLAKEYGIVKIDHFLDS